MPRHSITAFILAIFCLAIVDKSRAESDVIDEEVFAALRLVGHEILLASGDSTSRVLPIEKVNDRYKISFESEFEFEASLLSYLTDSVMEMSGIDVSKYIVEVKDCDSGKVMYSYKMDKENQADLVACVGRIQPKACYEIFMRIIPSLPNYANVINSRNEMDGSLVTRDRSGESREKWLFLFIGMIITGILYTYFMRIRYKEGGDLIPIGSYRFDQKNMTLLKGDEKQELTGKENDLLQLLYNHMNSTVDKEIILKEVWRDEGVYVGRTLDVYISKLRKKFAGDPGVNIINVRGVGYKLTMD